jgi:hypothetical protein
VSVWVSNRPTICNGTCGLPTSSGMTFDMRYALQGAQAECQQAEQTAGKQQAQLAQALSAEAELTVRLRGLTKTQVRASCTMDSMPVTLNGNADFTGRFHRHLRGCSLSGRWWHSH